MSEEKKCPGFFKKISWVFPIFEMKLKLANQLNNILLLIIRLIMAHIFWSSGVLKLPQGWLGVGQGNWESTLLLFEYEHPVPLLPVELAATMGTAFEILCPILLLFGFGSRIAAIILFSMALVIELTYQHSMEHIFWMSMLMVIALQGAGKISLDAIIRKKALECPEYKKMSGIDS